MSTKTEIKTVAEFKRRIKQALNEKEYVNGHHTYLKDGQVHPTWTPKELGKRLVGKVQSNSFAFITPKDTLSWLEWPKSSELSPIENGVKITSDWYMIDYVFTGEFLK